MENEIMNLRFNLTPKIQSLIIEMLVNKQMLEEGELEADKVKLMQKHINVKIESHKYFKVKKS